MCVQVKHNRARQGYLQLGSEVPHVMLFDAASRRAVSVASLCESPRPAVLLAGSLS